MLIWSGLAMANPDGAELARRAERLSVVGSVLYIAAHPDDENTRLLAHLVGERGLHTTYLSLTRGGGGQNLIGDQMSELLGVVRTGELLAARQIDGAEQRFTRARDFGYSKSADEALANWGHDEVLHDVVRVIREVQPDVVITRFGPDDDTHGHHVASAILAEEAMRKAADPAFITEGQAVWTVDRLLRNQSHWRIDADTDTSGWLTMEVGGYDPARGVSWGEVAAASRTMHKSQGFGSAPSVGPQLEYFAGVAGAVPPVGHDVFADLNTDWSRLDGTKAVQKALRKLRLDALAPARSLPQLAKVHRAISALPEGVWRTRKLAEVEQLILGAAGWWATAHTSEPSVSPGGSLDVSVELVARAAPVELLGARLLGQRLGPASLATNSPLKSTLSVTVPEDHALTRPHWLAQPPTAARYTQAEGPERTAPDTAAPLQLVLDLAIAGVRFTVQAPVEHAWVDRVHGERTHPLEVLPPMTATFDRSVRLVPAGTSFETRLVVRGDGGKRAGRLVVQAPPGTTVDPAEVAITLDDVTREQLVTLTVTPGSEAGALTVLNAAGAPLWSLDRIDLPHLPRRTVLRPAALEVVPVELARGSTSRIAYVDGSGDEVGRTLSDLGYTVVPLDEDGIVGGALDELDTVVIGIRAFNTRPRLVELQSRLHAWVEQGGRLIVQYQTSSSREAITIGPAPLTIGRERVTDEAAVMSPVDPAASVLNRPNTLTPADFDGWVQERGLYFASSFDPVYQPVFRMHDAGEEPLEGGLLLARHGKGTYVYTGISFFRQFPAGVPGAARLLANILAVEAP